MRISKTHFFYLYSLIVIIISAYIIPLQVIKTHAKSDHDASCSYYITLHAILGNSVGLSYDSANTSFIKHRFFQFENDLRLKGHKDKINVSSYQQQYQKVLQQYGISSISQLNDKNKLTSFAWAAYSTVDNFYLDPNIYCWNKLYWWTWGASRRILRYNLGGMYNHIDNRYRRILAAYPNDSQLGVYSGFLVNNQTTTLGTQFMTGMPLLTALYVLPYYDYAKVGSYSAPVPWGYFNPSYFVDAEKRKIMNIAGIDVFSVLSSSLHNANIKYIPDTRKLYDDTNPIFLADAISYYNDQSYGLAYLANHVVVADPKSVINDENKIKLYFSRPENRDPSIFTEITSRLYSNLNRLQHKNDILLETTQPFSDLGHAQVGKVDIRGLVGERIYIETDCKNKECILVLNVAYNRGWNAFLNGHKAQIERANYAFMAVHVPNGKSTLWFIYAPWSVTISYFISALTLVVILLLACGLCKNNYSRKRK